MAFREDESLDDREKRLGYFEDGLADKDPLKCFFNRENGETVKILKNWAKIDNSERRKFFRQVNFFGGVESYDSEGNAVAPVGKSGTVAGEIAKKENVTKEEVFQSGASRTGHTKAQIDARL